MAASDLTLRNFIMQVKSCIESSGLKLSPSIFSIQTTPLTILADSFCLDIQTADTGKYRNGYQETARVNNRLTVRVAKKLKPLDQFESQLAYLEAEEKVMAKMMERSNFPDILVTYRETRRQLTSSREYMIIEILFDCELDWSWASL
jgi:hypothetical protein